MPDREDHIKKAEKDFEPLTLTEIIEMNSMKDPLPDHIDFKIDTVVVKGKLTDD